MNDPGDLLRRYRLKRGLSQEVLADKLGYAAASSIHRREIGEVSLTEDDVNALGKALQLSDDEVRALLEAVRSSGAVRDPNWRRQERLASMARLVVAAVMFVGVVAVALGVSDHLANTLGGLAASVELQGIYPETFRITAEIGGDVYQVASETCIDPVLTKPGRYSRASVICIVLARKPVLINEVLVMNVDYSPPPSGETINLIVPYSEAGGGPADTLLVQETLLPTTSPLVAKG